MTLHAYAKINIGLHVLGKRIDGFHNIETIVKEIDLFDVIELEPHKSVEMTADSILVPIDENNLCMKAALLLQSEMKVEEGVMIHLKKNIPVGAGLGGGSSDAATVLRGLNKFWNLKLSNERLVELAEQIGADVPFFIEGGCAYATGKGNVLDHFSLNIPYYIVTVTPIIYISTKWAYKNISVYRDGKATDLKTKITKQISSPGKLKSIVQNDFEELIFKTYPEVENVKKKLLDSGAVFALMSGSGSSVFGFFKDEQDAATAISSFPGNYCTSITAPSFKPIH